MGHCLGGVLASSYLSAKKDVRISKYVSLNSPFNFSKMGEVSRLTHKLVLDVDKLVDSFGNVPTEFMNMSFQFINAGARFKALMGIFSFYNNKKLVSIYKALLKWKEDNIDMPGEFARKFLKEFYQENRLFNERMLVFGKKASLKNIKIPFLNIVSLQDDIAPVDACSAIKEKVKKVETIEFSSSHLAIVLEEIYTDNKIIDQWEKILNWLKK